MQKNQPLPKATRERLRAVLLSVLTLLNLGPSPTVHRKDMRTVVTSLHSQHLTTWHGCVSSLTAGTWLQMKDNLPIKASLWSRHPEAFWLQCSWTSYRKQDLLHISSCLLDTTKEYLIRWSYLGCLKVKVTQLCPTLVTPWTIQSMEFSRPEYSNGCPFPSPGDFPNPGIEPRSPALQVDSLPAEPRDIYRNLCNSLNFTLVKSSQLYYHLLQVSTFCLWHFQNIFLIYFDCHCPI